MGTGTVTVTVTVTGMGMGMGTGKGTGMDTNRRVVPNIPPRALGWLVRVHHGSSTLIKAHLSRPIKAHHGSSRLIYHGPSRLITAHRILPTAPTGGIAEPGGMAT